MGISCEGFSVVLLLFQWALLKCHLIFSVLIGWFYAISQILPSGISTWLTPVFSPSVSKQWWPWARWTPERCWKAWKLCWGRMESYGVLRELLKSSGEMLLPFLFSIHSVNQYNSISLTYFLLFETVSWRPRIKWSADACIWTSCYKQKHMMYLIGKDNIH